MEKITYTQADTPLSIAQPNTPALLELYDTINGNYYDTRRNPFAGISAERTDKLIDELDDQIIYIASPSRQGSGDTAPIGVVAFNENSQDDLLWVSGIAVRESYQGHGIGRELINQAETYARNHDIGRVALHSVHQAVPFYQALGYHPHADGRRLEFIKQLTKTRR